MTPAGEGASAPGSGRTALLVVDDEPLMLDLYRRALGRARPLVIEGDSRRAAERLASDEPFEGVICDVVMRPLSGLDVYGAVVRHRPALVPRFLFVTGGSLSIQEEQALEATGRRVLHKPFGVPHLLAAVGEVMPAASETWEVSFECGSWHEVYRIAREGKRGMLWMRADSATPFVRAPVTLAVRVRGESMIFEGRASSTEGAGAADGEVLALVELSIPEPDHLRLANALLAEPAPPARPGLPLARGSEEEQRPLRLVLEGLVLRRKRG